MSFHGCPIEPTDWTHGPDWYDGDCHNCDGTGEIVNDRDEEISCPECGGTGFREYEPLPDDVL